MKRGAFVLMAALALPVGLAAQTTIDQRRPAALDGEVDIENMAGTIKVVGWDKAEVWVKGTLAPEAKLDFDGSGKRTDVKVEVDSNPLGAKSDIEVHLPAGSRVGIQGFQAGIDVSAVTGTVEAETVNGGITLSGAAREVSLQSVNGAVAVTGPAGRVHVEVVNGRVTITGSSGELEASTVNGELSVSGGSYDRAKLESVAGSVRFDSALAKGARLDVETVSGSADLLLPAGVQADFSISTFSGAIENELGPSAVEKSPYTSEKELSFSTGAGGARIDVQTLSGAIHIRKKP
jgi:DUF4097 and DUF4098 domain-containing protein YvlB